MSDLAGVAGTLRIVIDRVAGGNDFTLILGGCEFNGAGRTVTKGFVQAFAPI